MKHSILHPCLKHHTYIKELCAPLEKLGVTFFGYTALDSANNAYCLGSKINYAEEYLARKHIKKDILFSPNQKNSKSDYYFWDFQKLDKEQTELYLMAAEFNQSHTLSITQYFNNMSHSFHFSGQNSDYALNQRLLEKMDCIHSFIDTFKDKLNSIHELNEIYQYNTFITQSEIIKPPRARIIRAHPCTIDLEELGRNMLTFSSAYYLSENERKCLKWLKFGKSAQIIAEINNVSRKTVERYITSIKKKFACYTLFQVGMHLGKSDLVNFLD